jgi:hypothetical protein
LPIAVKENHHIAPGIVSDRCTNDQATDRIASGFQPGQIRGISLRCIDAPLHGGSE